MKKPEAGSEQAGFTPNGGQDAPECRAPKSDESLSDDAILGLAPARHAALALHVLQRFKMHKDGFVCRHTMNRKLGHALLVLVPAYGAVLTAVGSYLPANAPDYLLGIPWISLATLGLTLISLMDAIFKPSARYHRIGFVLIQMSQWRTDLYCDLSNLHKPGVDPVKMEKEALEVLRNADRKISQFGMVALRDILPSTSQSNDSAQGDEKGGKTTA